MAEELLGDETEIKLPAPFYFLSTQDDKWVSMISRRRIQHHL